MNERKSQHSNHSKSISHQIKFAKVVLPSVQPMSGYTFIKADPTPDLIDQAMQCEKTFNNKALETFRLWQAEKVAHAQERVREGLDRICEDCGKVISMKRLTAMPNTTRCIRCQIKIEKRSTYSQKVYR